ncbi:MAG: glucose-6-phosphate isomerase [Candidatus Omnitrophica bacterium]|nr:glucose-6-phosphate isomerase [Candidatus Omnitrophota bacterium]
MLDTKYTKNFISDEEIKNIGLEVEKAHSLLIDKNSQGKGSVGWIDIPRESDDRLMGEIESIAKSVITNSDAIVIIGIGGSYLGARAAIETLVPGLVGKKIFFAGYNICGDHIKGLLDALKNKEIVVNVISKSGTTTEPALAFRIMENFMKKKYSPKKLKDRIICTTDRSKGAMRRIADANGYRSFVIPDDVGGRFSVLTAVGLFPMACAGIDIREVIRGAKEQFFDSAECNVENNACYRYAAIRNLLYRKGKKIEIFASFDNRMHYIDEWWKQLFGESEGKNGRGIFPASCDFSTDLHSMGQLIQEGERNIFETFLIVDKEDENCLIPYDNEDMDELNYLAGKQVDYVNLKAYEAVSLAHFEGGVPNMTMHLAERTPFCLGQLFYFFEKAAAISGYVSGVNPFDQPGVEAYKQKMFKLLGKYGS